ncbi:HNH endonuclease family protein [Actinacidiphila acididurans]|uniref:HNH endonuclease n=1 Tax=Actinacidiphila acididurans TaxID=2784346 RepID=A0ABS2TUQ7_9ACTN|nr:HNH endonuclease family protein [Actinacidiphila acididurans]MBM9506817.1 HNH endonuclease [Actinacidiphila acididurans]
MRSAIRTALAGVLACTVVVLTAPAHAADAPVEHGVALHQAVAKLPVAAEERTGYNRESSFGGWIDADLNGCNTRAEVLLDEAVTAPTVTGTCTLSGGSWYSWYDDTTVTGARALDIDHLVPLAEAWDSGASHWTKARRVAYANYLDDPRHLVAVTARANRSKADQDPAAWMPPSAGATCRYTADWLSVKLTWGLSIDAAEHDALDELAADCPDQDIVYSPVP